jgi:hypothetical protein
MMGTFSMVAMKRSAKAMNMEHGLKLWCEGYRMQGAPSVVHGQIKGDGQVRT